MNFPNEIVGTFNRNITLGTGTLKVYKDNALFLTFDENDIEVEDNVFTINVSNLFPNNGEYYINFTTGLFISVLFGEVYQGISNTTDWTFSIIDGEYEGTEYSNEYLIN
ncbi:hypothetical protein UFOVP299_6 [uncultured Caudovirales phage]|uniref:Uncharacterized protein n=1 Tax=uncultured Caudovirales phage TaxID=2100421 RepID=A0A6J5LSN5_9CAUD|nr:hypothetical protein UFOVP299_6 [uncultured Caudovirales phage]